MNVVIFVYFKSGVTVVHIAARMKNKKLFKLILKTFKVSKVNINKRICVLWGVGGIVCWRC